MDGTLIRNDGEISIDSNVIAKYAGAAADECFGIVGMASISMKDGLARLLRKDSITKGVNVEIVNNEIKITFRVIVAYGVSIKTVCENLMENVKYKVEEFTGLRVNSVDVIIVGVRVID